SRWLFCTEAIDRRADHRRCPEWYVHARGLRVVCRQGSRPAPALTRHGATPARFSTAAIPATRDPPRGHVPAASGYTAPSNLTARRKARSTSAALPGSRGSPRPLRLLRPLLQVLQPELVFRRIRQRNAAGRAELAVHVKQLAGLHLGPGVRVGHRLAGDDDAGDPGEVLAAHADGAGGARGIEVTAVVRLALQHPQLVGVRI